MDLQWTLRLTLLLLAGRSALNALELLSDSRAYSYAGLFSWEARRHGRSWTRRGALAAPFNVLLGGHAPHLAAVLQLGLALTLIVTPSPSPALLWSLFFLEVLSDFRNAAFGRDGSDRMHLLVFTALIITTSLSDPAARQVGVFFIAAQATLAYFTSGAIKLLSPGWRDGRALPTVLASENYGVPWIGSYLASQKSVSRFLGWTVILFEFGFPMGILLGPKPTLVLLTTGLLFHIGVAATMGLNSFVWSFAATYPAIYFVSELLHKTILQSVASR